MDNSDSDSSGGDSIATNVLLGFASKDQTDDDFSQLGGLPTWLDGTTQPPGKLSRCKVCNALMTLLLQLNADLPDRFPGHERRLYIFACQRKACRRKEGSVRAFRGCKHSATLESKTPIRSTVDEKKPGVDIAPHPKINLGETLFGVKTAAEQTNPFAAPKSTSTPLNPFSSTPSTASAPDKVRSDIASLPQTFAQKASISTPETKVIEPVLPWPNQSEFPTPYPVYYVDADKEYIDAEQQSIPAQARLDSSAIDGEDSSNSAEDKAAFESTMDKTFQKFADRLAQNPEQILRYEYGGQPLLYSKSDIVGNLLSPRTDNPTAKIRTQSVSNTNRIPRCTICGAARTFEMQLTPHAIIELEADEISIDGMDWGTVILCVCNQDCMEKGTSVGSVGYSEEWVGVQWEEIASSKRS